MSGKERARFPGALVTNGNIQIVVQVIERLSCLGFLGYATEVVKISAALIILPPVLFSDLLKTYIQSSCAEMLKSYFHFCL